MESLFDELVEPEPNKVELPTIPIDSRPSTPTENPRCDDVIKPPILVYNDEPSSLLGGESELPNPEEMPWMEPLV